MNTKDRIFQIADELNANGQNPTLAVVRKALGGGSFTTISEAMNEWKARKAAKERTRPEPAPQSVADRLADLGAELWTLALETANGRLAADREALDAAKLQLEAEAAEAAELADQVSAELEASRAKVAELERLLQESRNVGAGLRQEVIEIQARATTAETRAEELGKRVDDLNGELARVNGMNGELVKTLAGLATSDKKKG